MKTKETPLQDAPPTYKPPRLDVVSLRGSEVLALVCKTVTQSGPGTPGTDCQEESGPVTNALLCKDETS